MLGSRGRDSLGREGSKRGSSCDFVACSGREERRPASEQRRRERQGVLLLLLLLLQMLLLLVRCGGYPPRFFVISSFLPLPRDGERGR